MDIYPYETNLILTEWGVGSPRKTYISNIHFDIHPVEGGIHLHWYGSEPKPSVADVEVERLPYWKRQIRVRSREWASSINGRAYEDALPAAIDDIVTQDLRQAVREMINAFAAEEGLTARVGNAESKDAFKSRERFNLILLAGEARKEMKLIGNAYTIADDAMAYAESVGDATASAAWAAVNGGSTELADLLVDYPADYE